MKIGFKLTVIIAAIGIFAVASVGSMLLVRSRTTITDISEQYAVSVARDSASNISIFFDAYFYKAETAARVMEQYRSIPTASRRTTLLGILEGLVLANPDISAIWCQWEPNVLEGDDLQYLGTRGTNSGGYFSPYCYLDNGKVEVEAPEGTEDSAYIIPRDSGLPVIMDPYEYNVGGKTVLMTSICIPLRANGKVAGVIGFDIPLTAIQEISQAQKPFPDAIIAVFSNSGIITAHFDESRLGKDITETEADMAGVHLNDLVNAVKAGKPYSFFNHIKQLGTDIEVFTIPVTIGTTATPWSYATGVMKNTIMAPVYEMLNIGLLIGALVIILLIAAALILSRSISKPIVSVANTLRDISEGEGDLTQSIAVGSKDEIGDLALYFNKTLDKIKNLVINVKKEAAMLSNIGNDLASNMNETASAVNEITANIQSIKGRVINQSASVSETHATMEQVVTNINKLNSHVEKQSNNVSRASSAIEEMVANIHSVTATLIKNTANVNSLKEASEVGRNGLQEVASDIQEIARESEGLLEINSVMENIASQTNLLSMNA
ncbi:MAG: methyl-accepting chemotaxis protein, partial [Treponema sp.]|nr:methyl-accepting chemotaxis protein [Treponema sp.]